MSEIFRHFRYTWFDCSKMLIQKLDTGGVSMMLRPVENATAVYNVWIYLTPPYTLFSHKHSVNRLRQAYANNVVPFTQITLNGNSSLSEQLFQHFSLLSNNAELPSTVFNMLFEIDGKSAIAKLSMEKAKEQLQNSVNIYKDTIL